MSPLTILVILISGACIDPFHLNVGGNSKLLAVDGMITTAPGPYAVKLVWSSNVGNILAQAVPVSDATVTLFDNQGLKEKLSYQDSGVYKTSASGIQGVAGRTYHIEITTADGQRYSSIPEYLAPPGTIDSLYFEFKYGEAIVNGVPIPADGFNIYVNAKGNSTQSILRWRWQGTYKVFTHPELEYSKFPLMPEPYAPAPCSGYICIDTIPLKCFAVRQVSPCKCCTCYITQYQDVPFLSDNLFGGNTFEKYRVAFIPFATRNFFEKYYLQVQQFTLTTNTYQFWKLVQSQITGATNLFQPPIARIKGNIVSTSGSTSALGIFSACGVAQKTIWIYRNDVPYTFSDPIIRESCQILDPTSTIQIPPFWN